MRAYEDDELPSPGAMRRIEDGTEIETQLRRLCRYNTLISIRRSGDDRWLPSSILLVQPMLRRIVIDALPEQVSETGTLLHLRTRCDGAEIFFSSTILGRLQHDGGPALALSIPPSIRLHDRRVVRRVPIPGDAKLPPSEATLRSARFRFEITDVSVFGAGGVAHNAPHLGIGDLLDLQIELPASQLPVRAEIRSRAARGGTVRLGLRFTDMRPQHLEQLTGELARLERQALRAHSPHA
ncbi:flagellar brake protein [Solimonas marina]|uniref:C-di-GMP-binding flagellar brake protein YcgR, contains PilZNR and PilZ domains n=1 Tax=Solimonas marina TaxID=2714601 RepID=A0A969W6V0_9GAMM|nr:flagellar brake protein [Solimonas marina]NKF21746.1 hypothetical protein [Solimonas marina]